MRVGTCANTWCTIGVEIIVPGLWQDNIRQLGLVAPWPMNESDVESGRDWLSAIVFLIVIVCGECEALLRLEERTEVSGERSTKSEWLLL